MQTAFNDEPASLLSLSDTELRLMRGLLAGYQHAMLVDLKKGSLTETGIRNYRADLAVAGELMVKLGGAV